MEQLAKENKKFVYSQLQKGARSKDYEIALQWLKDSGLVHVVPRIKKPHLPLSAYQDNAFKLFSGLARRTKLFRYAGITN